MIPADDYLFLSALLKRESGLALGPGKEYLIESRLPTVAATLGLTDLAGLIVRLRTNPPASLVKSVCDAMTTGETLFFRDTAPFDLLRTQLLPDAAARARTEKRPIRVWCAACSTGQEVYSVAMVFAQAERELAGVKVELHATDYAAHALARAKEGVYNQLEVQRGLPVQLLVRFFSQNPKGYQIKPELREAVTFQEMNLLKPFTAMGLFDVIFLRNVLIYFDVGDKKDVLERISRQLHPGGVVLLGGSENTLGVTTELARVPSQKAAVYIRPNDGQVSPTLTRAVA